MRSALTALTVSVMMLLPGVSAAETLTCWFPPGWKAKATQAKAITVALSEASGVTVRPRIAKSYPQILKAFSTPQLNIVYVGSFVQAIIAARGLGEPLVQSINGEELYSGVLVFPKGGDPAAILSAHPAAIAFARGASSGELSAKAATGGQAKIATPNHGATCGAVKAGKAKAGVVKSWWWEKNKAKFPGLDVYRIPEISIEKNPDNVLTASNAVPPALREKIAGAAIAKKDVFGAPEMAPFDKAKLEFTLELMKKSKVDPMTYAW